MAERWAAYNEAVLRDSGSNSAPSSVKIVKLPLRLQVQWSRYLAKPLGRCVQARDGAVDRVAETVKIER